MSAKKGKNMGKKKKQRKADKGQLKVAVEQPTNDLVALEATEGDTDYDYEHPSYATHEVEQQRVDSVVLAAHEFIAEHTPEWEGRDHDVEAEALLAADITPAAEDPAFLSWEPRHGTVLDVLMTGVVSALDEVDAEIASGDRVLVDWLAIPVDVRRKVYSMRWDFPLETQLRSGVTTATVPRAFAVEHGLPIVETLLP